MEDQIITKLAEYTKWARFLLYILIVTFFLNINFSRKRKLKRTVKNITEVFQKKGLKAPKLNTKSLTENILRGSIKHQGLSYILKLQEIIGYKHRHRQIKISLTTHSPIRKLIITKSLLAKFTQKISHHKLSIYQNRYISIVSNYKNGKNSQEYHQNQKIAQTLISNEFLDKFYKLPFGSRLVLGL